MCRFYFMTCRYFEKQNKIHAPNTHSYNPIPMELLLICAYTFLGFISLISIIVFLQFEILDLEFFHVTLDSNFFLSFLSNYCIGFVVVYFFNHLTYVGHLICLWFSYPWEKNWDICIEFIVEVPYLWVWY